MDSINLQKEEYRIISDLTGFDNLKAMYEAEALMKRKKRKRKKKKRNVEYHQPQQEVTADAAAKVNDEDSMEIVEPLKTASVQIPQNDVPQKLVVDAAEEREEADTIKSVETINTLGVGGGVNSTEVIDLCSSPSEDNGASSDMCTRRDVGQTLPLEVILGEKNKRRLKKRIQIIIAEMMTVDSANKEKQADTVLDSAMPKAKQATPRVHDQEPVQKADNTSDAGMANMDEEAANKANADAFFDDIFPSAEMPSSSQSMPQPELRTGIEVLKAVAENMAKNLPGPSSQGDPASVREIDEKSGESQSDVASDRRVGGVEFSSSDDDYSDSSSFSTSGSSESVSEDSNPRRVNSGGDGVAAAVDDLARIQEAYTAFLKKFDSKDLGPIALQDIYPLSGQVSRFRGYTVAMEMVPVLQELFDQHTGLDAGSSLSATIRGPVLSVIGMVIHGLKTSPIADVTENLLLAWRDAISDAIAMGFDMEFVYLHLRRVAVAVFGCRMHRARHGQLDAEIQGVKAKIKSLQQRLQALKKKKESYTEVQAECLGEAKRFEGCNADAGLYGA